MSTQEEMVNHSPWLMLMLRDWCRLLLTGTVETEKIAPIAEALKTRVAEGQAIVCKGDLVSDGQAVMEAGKSDAVILVEEKHVSPIKDIDRSAELLNIGEANVIGFVVI